MQLCEYHLSYKRNKILVTEEKFISENAENQTYLF